jgi:putative SOS response-associated peptidase YedK
MCNLTRMQRAVDEVADLFGVTAEATNAPGEVYPGYPGIVVADGRVRSMAWGFPLAQVSKRTGLPIKPKAVNNARDDRLHTEFWRRSFEQRRCLIPIEDWAEADGETGSMTRTWFSLPDEPIMVCAGIWKDSDEWGPVYSMVTTQAVELMRDVNDRMPVILRPDQTATWLAGNAQSAFALCRTYECELSVKRSNELWWKR